MRWTDGYIAADWGTTNRRAYLIDSSGKCVEEFEDGKGVLSVESGTFPAVVAEIRERIGDRPLLLAGMVGSNRGWKEVPYVSCPAGIEDLVASLAWVGEREAIVPGVSYQGQGRADVMRGEEVQLLGAVADGTVPRDCLVCHPGTHNKWAIVAGGRIQSFRTVMTGELYNLLREHSILSDLLQKDVEPGASFGEGVRQGLQTDGVVADLFSQRAGVLLGDLDRDDSASRISGLLIGADVRVGLSGTNDTQIIVMGRPELTELYVQAIEEAGRKAVQLDGEMCFLAGIRQIAERIST